MLQALCRGDGASEGRTVVPRELYEATPPDGDDRVVCRKRRAVSIYLILAIVLTVEGAAYLVNSANPLAGRVTLLRLSYQALSLPVLIYALSAVNDYAQRRNFGPFRSLVVSLLVAGAIGSAAMPLMVVVGKHIPLIRDVFLAHKWSLLKAVVLGNLIGMLQLGLWALAFVYPFAAHDARVRALEAEKLRTEAELSRLRQHLGPHFVLNTLNAISGLVTEEPKEARRLLACLGDLLRDALRESGEMQSLAEQEAWLRRYAEILESRHRGSLRFVWDVDPNVKGARIPRLLLQPLVENAVTHGALRRREGGTVAIRAYRGAPTAEMPDGPVVCVVEDDGLGFADRPIRVGALGLSLVRRRLELRYQHADFRVETGDGGTRVVVEFDSPRQTSTVAVRMLTIDGTDAIAAGPPILRAPAASAAASASRTGAA